MRWPELDKLAVRAEQSSEETHDLAFKGIL
jgi:hypothetical protein